MTKEYFMQEITVGDPLFLFFMLFVLLVLLVIYFIPAIIARARRAENTGWIFIINLLFGSTGVGYFIVLIWAIVSKPKTKKR